MNVPITLSTQLIRGIVLAVGLVVLGSCDITSSSSAPAQLEGAWLGTGQFTAAAGKMDMKAQLEILPSGEYRYLIIEPAVMMMAGMEEGNWTRNGDDVNLTPVEKAADDPTKKKSVLFGAAPRNFQPKTLTIEGNFKSLKLDDGPAQLTFHQNEEATARLRERGEM